MIVAGRYVGKLMHTSFYGYIYLGSRYGEEVTDIREREGGPDVYYTCQ